MTFDQTTADLLAEIKRGLRRRTTALRGLLRTFKAAPVPRDTEAPTDAQLAFCCGEYSTWLRGPLQQAIDEAIRALKETGGGS